jgi:hypothetical protein
LAVRLTLSIVEESPSPKKGIIVEIPDNRVQTVTNTFHINTARRKKNQGEMFQTFLGFFFFISLITWHLHSNKSSIVREWRNMWMEDRSVGRE